jgi:small acid-soluble spore protein (thioredoxin-like protein)
MARPDSREENYQKLRKQAKHTLENLNESEEYLAEHAEELSPEEAANIRAKNERRRNAADEYLDEAEEEKRMDY